MTWRISEGRIDRLVVFKWRDGYRPVGELLFEDAGRGRRGRFVYGRSWLEHPERVPIDPIGLPLRRGAVAGSPDEVPLAFYDAAPDGWGRAVLAAAFPALHLGMAEILAFGGSQRTGDLSFGPDSAAPETWIPAGLPSGGGPLGIDSLEELLAAAAALEAGQATDDQVRLLVVAGADVGGARPKARLKHAGGDWIAKFPAWGDAFDNPRMEAVCLDLAELAGVPVPERLLLHVDGKSVLLVRRFDRSASGSPYSYLSAATLLKQPARSHQTAKTYVDVTVVARAIGVPNPEPELYRRLLVNAFLHNTDDHLRNMGFLCDGGRWRLAPAFDLVPYTMARHVCAPAPGTSPRHDLCAAAATHRAFGLGAGAARAIHDEVIAGMRRVREVFDVRGVRARDRAVVTPLLQNCFTPPI